MFKIGISLRLLDVINKSSELLPDIWLKTKTFNLRNTNTVFPLISAPGAC